MDIWHACFPPHQNPDACLAYHRDLVGGGPGKGAGSGAAGGVSGHSSGQPTRDLDEAASDEGREHRRAATV